MFVCVLGSLESSVNQLPTQNRKP